MSDTIKRSLRPPQAAEKCGISVPTLWRYIKERPDFPRPFKLSPRVTLIDEAELDAYLTSLRAKAGGAS